MSNSCSIINDTLEQLAVKVDKNTVATSKDIFRVTAEVKVKYGIESRKCYYVIDGAIRFRHQGKLDKVPDKFFLCDRSQEWKLHDKVLVLFSASGSGKTVDLAGSGAARGMDLAIVVSIRDTESNCVTDKSVRNEASMIILKSKINDVLKRTPPLVTLVECVAKAKRPLKINLAIDEASLCPKLVRSVIADMYKASEAVKEAMTEYLKRNNRGTGNTANIEVSFSVGGTGALTGVVDGAGLGSNVKSYEAVHPSARSFTSELCNHFLGNDTHLTLPGETKDEVVTYECIKEKLPVVEILMRNGRMSSIAAMKLKEKRDKTEVDEAKLVDEISNAYMESNGMSPLTATEELPRKHMVAACALAVHLFQWNRTDPGEHTPSDEVAFQTFMSEMNCGVTFSSDVERVVSEDHGFDNAMHYIVSTFGLLEPSMNSVELEPGGRPENLFVMQPAQQLVALVMLGMEGTDFLSPKAYGFEFLSTHIAKCAVACSCMIEMKSRPTLKRVLTKIGLQVDEKATSMEIRDKFIGLDNYKVIPYKVGEDYLQEDDYQTKQMNVELECVNINDNAYLQICKKAHKALMGMEESSQEEVNVNLEKGHSFLPNAWINYGSSPLADGFVTFYCKDLVSGNVERFTLMVQAKDYHENSSLDAQKLIAHAVRCDDDSLNGVFGEKKCRLLCVAGSSDKVLAKGTCQLQRNFIPYASNCGKILKELLPVLYKKRAYLARIKLYALFCDTNGDSYYSSSEEDTYHNKKRKKRS